MPESLLADLSAEIVHLTYDHSEELIVSEVAWVINVEDLEDSLDLFRVSWDTVVMHSSIHFFKVQVARSVLIHYFEGASESQDTACTTALDFLGNSLS